MKNSYSSGLAMAVLAAAACLAPRAWSQTTPGQYGTFTNLPATVAAGAVANQTSRLTLQQNTGLALAALGNVSAGTNNVVYQLRFSTDGTNDQTVPINWIIPATGVTNFVAVTNWSAAQLAGFSTLNLTAISNQNSGTFTNQGVNWSRWISPVVY